MILTGNCQLKYDLRLKNVIELISNWNVCDNEDLNLYSAWESFEEKVLESVKIGTYSSLTHTYSLSNLFGCRIVSIYPNTTNPCVNRNFFNKTIFPIENKFLNTFLRLCGWSPNHFVPCVKKVFVKEKTTLHVNMNRGIKCQNKDGGKKCPLFLRFLKENKNH